MDDSKCHLEKLEDWTGGTLTGVTLLPDGSGFATLSMPLASDHWIYGDSSVENHGDGWSFEYPPMPMRIGTDNPERQKREEMITAAGRYALRAATMKGRAMDFDPDSLIQNLIVGLLGYHTPDGLSGNDDWANPPEAQSLDR